MSRINLLYNAFLLLSAGSIWYLLITLQYLEYDENFGQMIQAFFISLAVSLIMAIVYLVKPFIIKANKWSSLVYLLFCSPVTILLLCLYYNDVFSVVLKH